jgi:hypothetical protein
MALSLGPNNASIIMFDYFFPPIFIPYLLDSHLTKVKEKVKIRSKNDFSETEEYQKFLSKMVKIVKGKYTQNINQYQSSTYIQHHPYLPGHVCPPCM